MDNITKNKKKLKKYKPQSDIRPVISPPPAAKILILSATVSIKFIGVVVRCEKVPSYLLINLF